MIKIIQSKIPYLIFLLLSLIFIYPYAQKGFILASGESQVYLNPHYINYCSSWNDKFNFGWFSYEQNNIILFSIFWKLLGLFSSLVDPSIIFIFLSFLLPCVTFYYVADKILSNNNKFILIPGSLIYSYNVYRTLGPLNERLNILFIFLPIFYFLYYRLLTTKKWVYVHTIVIMSLLSSSMGGNLPIFTIPYVMILIMFCVYFIYNFPLKGIPVRKIIIQNFVLFILLILINLYWLIPLIRSLFLIFNKTNSGTAIFTALSSGYFYDHFRLIGSWAWKQYYYTALYYVFSVNYYHQIIILSTYFIAIFSYLYVFNIKKDLSKITILVITLIGFVFLAGIKGPFYLIYKILYDNIFIFRMYREPFIKFMPLYVFGLSFGIVYSLEYLEKKWSKLIINLVTLFLIMVILINAHPFFTTKAIPTRKWNAGQSTALSKIPDYWLQAKNYIDNDQIDSNYLLFPWYNYGTSNNWVYGINVVGNVADYIISRRNIKAWDPDNSDSGQIIKNIFYDQKKSYNLSKYIGFLNTKLIMQENDLEWRYSQTMRFSPSQSNFYLRSHQLIKVADFGLFTLDDLKRIPNDEPNKKLRNVLYQELINQPGLVIYKIKDADFYPIIYVPRDLIVTKQKISRLPKIITDSKSSNFAVYFTSQISKHWQQTLNQLDYSLNNNAVVEYKKISSYKYRVILHQANGTIPLILSQSYDQEWKIFPTNNNSIGQIIDKNKYKSNLIKGTIQNNNLNDNSIFETWSAKPILNQDQIKVNGYANSWIINIDQLCKDKSHQYNCKKNPLGGYDVEFVIEFGFQNILIKSFIISVIVTFICLLSINFYLIDNFLKKSASQKN